MKLYTNSTQSWNATLRSISNAKKSIYIEMYIFSEDTHTTHDFVTALCDRAHKGVQVIMILDAFGSMGLSNATIDLLTSSGVEVRFFRHWIHRTHRKTVIVDGVLAYIGGVNITRHAQDWNDLQLEVTGAIVRRLLKIFTRTYKLSGGTTTLLVQKKYVGRNHRVRMWILEHTPLANQLTLKHYYTKKLANAKQRITFLTPYFIPHRWLINAMHQAIERGIEVELLVPEATESRIIDAINTYYISKVLEIGVTVYVTSGTNHAKAVLIDTYEGLIGSANIDSLSFERNNELGIFFTDQATVGALKSIIDEWKGHATRLTEATAPRLPWYYSILAGLLRLIHPFI